MNTLNEIERFNARLAKGSRTMGVELTQAQIELMSSHARELMLWNRKMNLTAIRDPEQMAEKHFLDAIRISPFLNKEHRIMDMGTGGGFPSLPLKILNPDLEFCLVDSVRKKVSFLNHVIRVAGLKGIKACHSRVEDLAGDSAHAQSYDAVISRGFADLEVFVSLAEPMVKPGGSILALKGEHGPDEITRELNTRFNISTEYYQLPFDKADRYLIRLESNG